MREDAKFIVGRDNQSKATDLDKKRVDSANEFNKIMPTTHKYIVKFYEKISLFSAGTISLSITAIIALEKLNQNVVNDYKYLFIIGIGALLLSLLAGISYAYANVTTNFLALKLNWGKSSLEYQEFIDSLPPKTDKEREKDFLEKGEKRYHFWDRILTILTFICPISFILGLTLLSTYFCAQIFDF
ncbi:MAG: hypothetical protein US26_C0011G0004 [Candidatus Nomurabacteria bacterium GW2011_GWE1_36_71]|nr:MAG: hypothetical protein US26_C0011G0004 [Candidatus Nomurabacteria bacterium GW2011_GWE1_36_71]